jgi:hypothetical protein
MSDVDSSLDFSFLKEVQPRKKAGRQVKTLIGRKFGRLTPLGFLGIIKFRGAKWLCHCDCGNFTITDAAKLLQGRAVSCRCYGRALIGVRSKTHSMTNSRIYHLWADMLTRARNPNYKQAKDYSERGITICERWLSFENFFKDMGQPPSPKHSIERRNNNLGYSPDNCYWATKIQQARNTRTNRFITYESETLCMAEWAERLNMNYGTFCSRIYRSNRSEEDELALIVKERN